MLRRWGRAFYQPCLPLGEDGKRVSRCKEHIQLSHDAAAEGMVLLKNEQEILPLPKGTKVALFGKASVDYVKGGGGSGEVYFSDMKTLQDGMECKEREGKIEVFAPLGEFYRRHTSEEYAQGVLVGRVSEPEISVELLEGAKNWADVAILSICRFSEEGADRRGVAGDFYLSKAERNLIQTVTENFAKVVVVLNIGGVIETGWIKHDKKIQGALLAWQAGTEGGLVAAELLCGDRTPCGKLVDTFADRLEDYPSTASFGESPDYVNYTEDIYVGYRYFETIPEAKKKVVYPFGYGLSYTDFDISIPNAQYINGLETIYITVHVTNRGKYEGKEIVQLYHLGPQGELGRPNRVLGAFQKTSLLKPGESEDIVLLMSMKNTYVYDDLGKIAKSAYVFERGRYSFFVGKSVREGKIPLMLTFLNDNVVKEQLTEKCPPLKLPYRMLADGTYENLPQREGVFEENQLEPLEESLMEGATPLVRAIPHGFVHWAQSEEERNAFKLEDVANGKVDLDTFMAQLSDEQLIDLLGGQPLLGVANTFGMGNIPKYGVPNIMTADGPAGVRLFPECGIDTTTWPCATMLACTWNIALLEKIGSCVAKELKENNIGTWLAPAMNIHRNPLCGRNFEYYSEDPFVSGKMAGAMVRGVQSQKVGAEIKHFCCNNKEYNRKDCDSRVSERALREIYLKGFEIAVKESQPWAIMSSYNMVNGRYASSNKDLLTGILREEWGYQGIVTTDWWTHEEHYLEIKAGNDVKMATGYPERAKTALENGWISREEIYVCARRVLEMILKQE